jgi:Asp-tRNA(Asn)/Glu-tRNA(Gln) amidotransferase A subunit family amidase
VGALERGARGLRVGVVRGLFADGVDGRVAARVREALDALARAGARVQEIDVPGLELAGAAQQAMMLPEATEAHLPWLRTRLADYGPDVRVRLLAGLALPSTAYVLGQRARRVVREALRAAFARVDLLASPAMPVVAPPVGATHVTVDGRELPYRLALIPFNVPWSFAGVPAASLPAGLVDGLPVGLALAARPFADATVLRAGHAFQQVTDHHTERPPVAVATT